MFTKALLFIDSCTSRKIANKCSFRHCRMSNRISCSWTISRPRACSRCVFLSASSMFLRSFILLWFFVGWLYLDKNCGFSVSTFETSFCNLCLSIHSLQEHDRCLLIVIRVSWSSVVYYYLDVLYHLFKAFDMLTNAWRIFHELPISRASLTL